jgi:uncharacterized protein (DUF1697 family)
MPKPRPTPASRYVALLRGINVGGSNVIKMADLRACFEELGLEDVATYIQSGNVVFSAPRSSAQGLTAAIERALGAAFDYDSRVVVVSAAELARVVEQAPKGFGSEPATYRYDVLFVRPPLAPAAVLGEIAPKPGVDAAHAGERALYFRRLIAKASQSRLTRLTQRAVYRELTIRNWNTTTKLLALARDPRETAAARARARGRG